MKRLALAAILAAAVFAAFELLRTDAHEVILGHGAQRLLAASAALVLGAWLARGASTTRGVVVSTTVVGVLAALLVGYVAVFPPQLATTLDQDELVKRFRILYYTSGLFANQYLGIKCLQYPTDQWMMQEIISEVRPDFILETGTWTGATTLFYAHILEKIHPEGQIVTIDIKDYTTEAARHPAWAERVHFILGDSVGDDTMARIHELVTGGRVLVTLDSSHATEHVARELELYAPLVSVGSYLVVQDTQLGGNPNHHPSVDNPGPLPAVRAFLAENPQFQVDRERERHLLTQNPSGYLKRVY